MDIIFDDRNLRKYAENEKKCRHALGPKQAELFFKRLNDFHDATTLEDLRYVPGHYHELTKNLKGYFGCDLDQPNRLVFAPLQDPIPTDSDGKCIWSEITGVKIMCIMNYHKEK